MLTKNKFIGSVLLTFVASTSLSYANIITWDFAAGSANYDVDNSGNAFGNSLSIDSNDDGTAELTIQAWADTGCGWNCGSDAQVFQGFATTNIEGLLNFNLDTSDGSLTGEDSVIDNRSDVDMMFFSFSESTALIGIDIGSYSGDTDISIAAFSSMPSLSGNTWVNIVGQSIFSASFSNLGSTPYSLQNEVAGAVVESKYWLVGAYISVFGDSGENDNTSDKFILASITTQTSVPEPSTISMFASFALLLMWRRKRSA